MAVVRIGIQLPEAYERKARRIAKYKGVPRASWIANCVQSRIETIYNDYLKMWERDAAEAGMSLEDFLTQLDNGDDSDD